MPNSSLSIQNLNLRPSGPPCIHRYFQAKVSKVSVTAVQQKLLLHLHSEAVLVNNFFLNTTRSILLNRLLQLLGTKTYRLKNKQKTPYQTCVQKWSILSSPTRQCSTYFPNGCRNTHFCCCSSSHTTMVFHKSPTSILKTTIARQMSAEVMSVPNTQSELKLENMLG